MSRKQWWADNKKTVICLTVWAVSVTLMLAMHQRPFSVWYVLLMLAEGLLFGFSIGVLTLAWRYEADETYAEPAVAEPYCGVTVDVPRGAKFSTLTWDMARKAYNGIRTEHADWKTWDQLNDTAQWLLMAHVDAGSRMTIQLAKHFNNEDEEETA